jgi:hypothetical protein
MKHAGLPSFLVVSVAILVMSCSKKVPFDSKKWKTDPKSRYPMVLALINDPILIGKSKSEIERLLGRPNQSEAETYVYFYEDGGIIGIYFATPYLAVRFDGKTGKCDKVFTSD